MFHDRTAVAMLGCGWEEGGEFFEFRRRTEEGALGFLACLAIHERGWRFAFLIFLGPVCLILVLWFPSLAWALVLPPRAHRKSLLLLKREAACCGTKRVKGQLWHPFQMHMVKLDQKKKAMVQMSGTSVADRCPHPLAPQARLKWNSGSLLFWQHSFAGLPMVQMPPVLLPTVQDQRAASSWLWTAEFAPEFCM
jgi:MFS family permease